MQKYDIRILKSAWDDLSGIELWYLYRFDSDTALKVSSAILDALERLVSFPDSGKNTPDMELNKRGYRMITCKFHAAIYKKVDHSIFIYHVFDMRTDYTKLFSVMREEA